MKTKFLGLALAAAFFLSGCSVFDGQYVRVTPHKMPTSGSASQAYTVDSDRALREALESLAASGTEKSVIYVEGFPLEKMESTMESAKKYLCSSDPVGTYAVERFDYQIGSNNGRDAVAVDIGYRRSPAEIQRIAKVVDIEDARQTVLKALSSCEARVVMLIRAYTDTDFTQMVRDLAQMNPQTVMEIPQVTEGIYGKTGSRVVELSFTYENSRDSLRLMQSQVRPIFDAATLYVSGDVADQQKYAQLYAFLMERFDYTVETSITPAYSLLRHGVGDSRAFATVYASMCRLAGLDCQTVTGTRWGDSWTWNIIRDNGRYYHVDLLRCSTSGGFRENLDSAMGGYVWDYSAYPVCDDLTVTSEPDSTEEIAG